MGRGMGMGGCGGRGMGRGMGCGGGKGMGMGAGRGGGAGRVIPRDRNTDPWFDNARAPGGPEELSSLKQQANQLADELTRIRQRIDQLEKP